MCISLKKIRVVDINLGISASIGSLASASADLDSGGEDGSNANFVYFKNDPKIRRFLQPSGR